MDVTKVSKEKAEETFAKAPDRRAGKWTELCTEVKKSHQAVEVSGLKKGQVAHLVKKARDMGLRARALNHMTGVLVLPAESKKAQ